MFESFLAVALMAAAGLAVHAFWIEPRRLVVTRVRVASPHWPAAAPELRIAVMADLHAGGPHVTPARLAGIVARVNAERPDLVLLLGDYVFEQRLRTSFVPPEVVAEALAGLEAPLGAFGVLGNHDWRFDGPRIGRALEKAGVVVLENDARRVEAGDTAFWVAGLGDLDARRADLPGTLARVTDDAPVLLLSHSPDVFPAVPDRVALTLAGHTHGGQVDFPLVGPLYVPSKHSRRYLRGYIREGGRRLFVSTGIGSSSIPVRFRVPPEIVIVTLYGAAGG